jgi:hypothetical protein
MYVSSIAVRHISSLAPRGVQHFGWRAAPAIVLPAALFGLAVAFMIRRAMDCHADIEQGRREGKSK